MPPVKLLLCNSQSPGDVLMMTAAVRDLHRAHPRKFKTAVQTSCPDLWLHNPYVTPAAELGRPDHTIECHYPLIHLSDTGPYHFVQGFAHYLEWKLGVTIPLRAFQGDLHLGADELERPTYLKQAGVEGSFWIVIAGGKFDFTAKWWSPAAYQSVVDHFQGRIRFVQCGEAGHWHPPLRNATNLVGKTSLREFVRLVYHADGVLCPVTLAMHVAAAAPVRPGQLVRACVVIAGGREPVHWEAYPGHQFLHTIGSLDCCATGGCWKSRCQAVGDGDPADLDLCPKPVSLGGGVVIPKCMSMIEPEAVIRAIDLYYQGGSLGHHD